MTVRGLDEANHSHLEEVNPRKTPIIMIRESAFSRPDGYKLEFEVK